MTSKPITELDFDTFKEQLKEFLKAQDRFKDYDYEGSNMSVLLDVLAYNAYQQNFYTNMVFSEMFLDSAQTRSAMLSHAKELNYVPRSVQSARATVDVRFNAPDNPPSITIPRHTKFTSRAGGKTFTFVNLETVVVKPVNGEYCYNGLSINQGRVVTEFFEVDGNLSQRFNLSNDNADIQTVTVNVRESENASSAKTEYVYRESILGVGKGDKAFYLESSGEDGQYGVLFGQNVFGRSPVSGNVVEVTYLVTDGEEANGLYNFNMVNDISGYTGRVTTKSKSSGGADREDLESIRFFAPKSAQVQDRAVTETDYEILLKSRFPEVEAVSVYGGEEVDPPQFGRVIVAVSVKGSEAVPQSSKTRFKEYLQSRSPLTVEPVIQSPEYMYLALDTTVFYDDQYTKANRSDIQNDVKNAVLEYSRNNLSDFRSTLRHSRLLQKIDASNENIISNNTSTKAVIQINPVLRTEQNFSVLFDNELNIGPRFTKDMSVSNNTPAITSTPFMFNSNEAFLMDDGTGKLMIVQSKNDGYVVMKYNSGTVDYKTGMVNINKISVNSYGGSGIKIYANTKNRDIIAPKKRILRVREEDLQIAVKNAKE